MMHNKKSMFFITIATALLASAIGVWVFGGGSPGAYYGDCEPRTDEVSPHESPDLKENGESKRFFASIQFYDPDRQEIMPYSPHLNTGEQCFIINFSMAADKKSVEKAITDNTMHLWHGEYVEPVNPEIMFNWIDSRRLVLWVDNLTENIYCVSVEGASDQSGEYEISGSMIDWDGIYHNIFTYEAHPPQSIILMDPDTMEYEKTTVSGRYHFAAGVLSPEGEKALIGRITNSFEAVHYIPVLLDLSSGMTQDVADDAWNDFSSFWNGRNVLWYNYRIDTYTGAYQKMFDTPILSSLLLENGKMIVLNTTNGNQTLMQCVYGSQGGLLWQKELPDQCQCRIWEGGFYERPILYERADGRIITSLYDPQKQVYNVFEISADIEEDDPVMIHENAYIAAVSPDGEGYAVYRDLQGGNFRSGKIELYYGDNHGKTIEDDKLVDYTTVFWRDSNLYLCYSGHKTQTYLHIINTDSGERKTVYPDISDTVLFYLGITPEGRVAMMETCYNISLFR